MIDQQIAVIGTFNLDPRSANLNTECVTVIYDSKIAGALHSAMEEDMKPENSWHTTTLDNPDHHAGWWKRIRTWFRGVVPKSVL